MGRSVGPGAWAGKGSDRCHLHVRWPVGPGRAVKSRGERNEIEAYNVTVFILNYRILCILW